MDDHRHYGVDVKVQRAPEATGEDKLSESELEMVWTRLAESFWIHLEGLVRRENLADTVYAEGRSGGWAVPEPKIDPETEPEKFAKFTDLVEKEFDHFVDEMWPNAVLEEVERLAKRKEEGTQSFDLKIVWLGDGQVPEILDDFLSRIFSDALGYNGFKNFELEVERKGR